MDLRQKYNELQLKVTDYRLNHRRLDSTVLTETLSLNFIKNSLLFHLLVTCPRKARRCIKASRLAQIELQLVNHALTDRPDHRRHYCQVATSLIKQSHKLIVLVVFIIIVCLRLKHSFFFQVSKDGMFNHNYRALSRVV